MAEEKEYLKFYTKPSLRSPYVVCGFESSFNAGDASAGLVNYLINQFKAIKFAEMETSRYHIYQMTGADGLRPIFKMEDGLIVESELPKDEFYYVSDTAWEHDLILLSGNEPNLNWEEYANSLVTLAGDFGASRLYTSCGIYDMSPYTREPIISCTCTSDKIRNEMEKYNVTFSNREGPASFAQMLMYVCKKNNLEGVNFTVRAPYYPEFNIALSYSPKSIKAILVRIDQLMHINISFDELNDEIKELEKNLDSMRQKNPQFKTFIEEQEKNYVEMSFQEPLDISPSDAIKFAEEFLKEHKDPGKDKKK
jgi:proteasome assembly chaperone (PAC2) family protein